MRLKIIMDIDTEQSNLNEDELKSDLLNGVYEDKVVFDLKEVDYSD